MTGQTYKVSRRALLVTLGCGVIAFTGGVGLRALSDDEVLDPDETDGGEGWLREPQSSEKTCENCALWDQIEMDYVRSIGVRPQGQAGFCRLNPPSQPGKFFVNTYAWDRCSHHQPKEA